MESSIELSSVANAANVLKYDDRVVQFVVLQNVEFSARNFHELNVVMIRPVLLVK